MIIGLLAPGEEKVRASTRRHSPSSKNRRKMRRRRRRRGRRFRFQLFHRPSRAARDRPNLYIYIEREKKGLENPDKGFVGEVLFFSLHPHSHFHHGFVWRNKIFLGIASYLQMFLLYYLHK